MLRVGSGRNNVAVRARARLVLVGVLGSLVLLGAVSAAVHAASSGTEPHDRASYVVQHEATVAPSVANPSRSHRFALSGLSLLAAGLAAVAAHDIASRRRRITRRRVEQFHIRRRGPPVLLVAR